MKRWLVRIGILVGIVAAVVALRLTVFAPDPLPVTVVEAARGRVEESVTNTRAGTVKARRRAQLSPQIGGRVVAIPFREGARVKAGDVLLRLDADLPEGQVAVTRRELQAARAQREQACANAERAVRERDRLQKLAREGIVSADVLDQAQTAAAASAAGCRAAQAGIEQARSTLELAERQSGQFVLRAPFDGIIADVAIELGEYTTPSPPAVPVPPILDIIDPASLFVSAPMDEVDSSRIHPGQPARVTIDSYPGRSFAGRVTRVAPYVLDRQEQNRTVEIEVELDNPGVQLLPGTSADAEVILSARDGALRIPTATLLEGDEVLVVEDGKLVERKLTLGLRNWDWTEVREGLAEGDRVVSSLDRPEVKAGAEVQVVSELPETEP
jgi:HlyD family secretion protein